MDLNDILIIACKARGSDVHIKAGLQPVVRIDGRLRPIPNAPRMSADAIREMAYSMMNEKQKAHFEEFFEVDLAYGIPGLVTGTLGVFGPMRMPYGRTIPTVRFMADLLSGLVSENMVGENNEQ